MAKKSTKRKPVRKTKAQRLTLDEQMMGVEPTVGFFEENSLHDFFNWYNYMYDRKKVNQVIINYAKKFKYKNAARFSRMFLPGTLASIIRGLENGIEFPDHRDYPDEGSAGWQKHIQ